MQQNHLKSSRKMPVRGYDLPSARLTRTGVSVILRHAVAPFLVAMLALDLIAYAVWTLGFGKCYGLLCWIGI
ncbi:MAG: hypothetical protein AAGF15_03765 [Pseudomonadota bacterium]